MRHRPPIVLVYGTSGEGFERNSEEIAYSEGLGVRRILDRQTDRGRGHRQRIKMGQVPTSSPSSTGATTWELETMAWEAFPSHQQDTLSRR